MHTTPINPSIKPHRTVIKPQMERHRPTRAAKSLRYMTKDQKSQLQRQAQALYASEAAGNVVAVIGRAAWSRAHIPAEFLQDEPQLSAHCWPEYLYLSPLERTRRFTADYIQAFSYYAKRLMDSRKISQLCLIDPVLEHNAPANISALWRARQKADELGIPYEKYVFPLIEHALDVEGHTRLPLPNQLYDIAQIMHVYEKWEEWVRDGSFVTSNWDARLKAENYRGSLEQHHCHEVLIGLIGQSVGRLEQFMLRDRLLPEVVARARLGDELVDRALARHGSPAPCAPATPVVYIRPCLGLLASPISACSGCPFTDPCARVARAVDHEMGVVYRSTDPRLDHKRTLARDRKRRQRERDRKRDTDATGKEML